MTKFYLLDCVIHTGSFKIQYGAFIWTVLNGLADIELVQTGERKNVRIDSLRKSNTHEIFLKGIK